MRSTVSKIQQYLHTHLRKGHQHGFVESMRSAIRSDQRERNGPDWHDRKRYLWLFAAMLPVLVAASWLTVQCTGWAGFWWLGTAIAFGIVPLADFIVGSDAQGPPDSALAWLENDPFYRW